MINKKSRLRFATEILCFLLIFAFAVCMIPLSATEEAETDKEEKPKTIEIVKLLVDVKRGIMLAEEDVELVEVKNENIPANVVTSIDGIDGMYVSDNMYAGEYVNSDCITENKVYKINEKLLKKNIHKANTDYVNVTDYIVPNTGDDLSYYLQEIIDKNPKRTIYFPDGVYTIASPLFTSAGGGTSVDLQLADGAVIKAHVNWRSNNNKNALICMGASKDVNDIVAVGSYYTLVGGTLDGNDRANGVSIDSGRESVIRNICIKNCLTGIKVEDGTNNVSSDCDFEDITIMGNPKEVRNTYGVYVIGYDNTFTNIRIYNVGIGFYSKGAGNFLKSIYVINNKMEENFTYKANATVGISGPVDNRYSQCYVENCATAYDISSGSLIWDCTANWTDPNCSKQIAVKTGDMRLSLGGIRAYFTDTSAEKAFVSGPAAGNNGSPKVIEGCIFDPSKLTQDNRNLYNGYLKTDVIVPIS